jgi:hypothetical protein
MAVKAGILMLAAAMWVCLSAVVAFDVPSVAFDEGFSPLFGDDNLVRARDDRTVRLLLDRRSGNPSPSSQIFSPFLHPISARARRVFACSVLVIPMEGSLKMACLLHRFRVHLLRLLPPRLLQRVHQAAQGLHGRRRRRLLCECSIIHAPSTASF